MLTVADYLGIPPAAAHQRIAYGSASDQFGDLYLPAGPGPHPVIVLLHGGCWQAAYGLDALGPLAQRLSEGGAAVWSLEYRRIGSGGGWPATFLDVATGADHLRRLAAAHALDLRRVAALGHSAGGHLALWLAARHRLPPASDLSTPDPLALGGVVALAGLPDLATAGRLGLCDGAVQELLGGTPEAAAAHMAEASPAHVMPLGVPHIHIVGVHDEIAPPSYLAPIVEAAQAQGDDARLYLLPDAGHFEVVAVGSSAWPTVERAIFALLNTPKTIQVDKES